MKTILPHLIIFGAQGSGKGTQAAALAEQFGLSHINTGAIYRSLAAQDTELGRRIHSIIAPGNLVPDDLTKEVIERELAKLNATDGFILDGYPRTLPQTEDLKEILVELDRREPRPIFIVLKVPKAELLRRIRFRAETEQRHDDTDEGIARRLKIFEATTAPIIHEVEEWADVVTVDADAPIPVVTARILEALSAHTR